MNRYLAFGIVAVVLIAGGWWYFNQSSAPAASQTSQLPTTQQDANTGSHTISTQPAKSINNTDQTNTCGTYTNAAYGYSIKCPTNEAWIHEGDGAIVMFGTPASKPGGYIWQTEVWSKSEKSLENLIARYGSQFSDRKESRKNITVNGMPALFVTVSTNKEGFTDWISNTVYIEHNDKIYVISDGAVGRADFADFYNSFSFTQ